MTGLWEKLRQRKLVQWALAYVAFAFALLQGIDIVAGRFDWPAVIEQGMIVALCIGFFVALVVAWYHGERGEQRVTGMEIILLAVLLAIGSGLMWEFTRTPEINKEVAAPAPVASKRPAPGAAKSNPGTKAAIPARSIAVLPFVNMSGDKNNEYFSDGVSEEILNVLAEVPDLKVAARTSSFSFKDSKEEVPQIARQLGVRMVLEGSVRKQGDRVRITAQLIDSSTGFQVWSHTYDRELQDIFAVQDQIAQAIGGQLQLNVMSNKVSKADHRGTSNTQAYDHYLRGIALWQTRKEANLWQAVQQFEESIKADPKFAQAWGGLALVYAVLPDYTTRITYADADARLTDAAERALALDPNLPEPYAALAIPASFSRRETGIALLQRAISLRPSFATAYQWLGNTLFAGGHPREGMATLQRAATLDPHSIIVLNNEATVLLALKRTDDARAACDHALEFAPDFAPCLDLKGLSYLIDGKPEAARSLYLRAIQLLNPQAAPTVSGVFDALEGHGDRQAVIEQLASLHERDPGAARGSVVFGTIDTPTFLMLLGAQQQALDYLDYEIKHPGTGNAPPEWALFMPVFDSVRCTPRFVAMVQARHTTDPRAAEICGGDNAQPGGTAAASPAKTHS